MKVNQSSSNSVQSTEVSGTSHAERLRAIKEKKAQTAHQGQANDGATAQISTRAKEFSKAKEAAASAPDVREQKIAELKKKISDGKYKVDAGAIADRLVDEHIQTQDLE